jgi:hypothetical protein
MIIFQPPERLKLDGIFVFAEAEEGYPKKKSQPTFGKASKNI